MRLSQGGETFELLANLRHMNTPSKEDCFFPLKWDIHKHYENTFTSRSVPTRWLFIHWCSHPTSLPPRLSLSHGHSLGQQSEGKQTLCTQTHRTLCETFNLGMEVNMKRREWSEVQRSFTSAYSMNQQCRGAQSKQKYYVMEKLKDNTYTHTHTPAF